MRTTLRGDHGLRMARRLKMSLPRRAAGGQGVLKLYLLRHGETEFSRSDRFCGDIDAPLTDAGRLMGEQFAAAYARMPWRAIVTSTRQRARATAAPLAARTRGRILRDPRLDEIFYGDWQGLTKSQAQARDPGHFRLWRQDPTIGPPAGESPFEVCERATAAIDDLRTRYGSGNVLVVSHKTVLRIVLCRLLNLDLRCYRDSIDWRVGAVTVLELGPCHSRLVIMGDVSHLQPQAAGDLVGEQEPVGGQLQLDVVDGEPAGLDGRGDGGLATAHGIDPMTGTMLGAVDAGDSA
jgi:alpha-ribazole phosphatase